MNATIPYDLPTLLESAGAQPPRYGRGKWGCPRHRGSPSLSIDLAKGLFNCHHAGCDFHGSTGTLARAQGLTTRLTAAEYRELRQNRDRADHAARALYERVKVRRFELLDFLRTLDDEEATAHRLGPDNPETWDALSTVHAERPAILAELTILENASAADLLRFLSANPEAQERAIYGVFMRGGLSDAYGRFMEVRGA